MTKREYSPVSAAAMIERNGGKVTPSTRTVFHREPGCGTLGAIDYMVKEHRYVWKKEN